MLGLRARAQNRLGGAHHRGDDHVGQHPEVIGRPVRRVGQPGEVSGQLALDELDLVADRRAHRRWTSDAFARDEGEVVVLGVDVSILPGYNISK